MAFEVEVSKFKQEIFKPNAQATIERAFGEERTKEITMDIVSLVLQTPMLAKCDLASLIYTCLMTYTLKLPISKQLGQCWIIPYGNSAQLQVGFKGYLQLAIRSGQYKTINVAEIYEGELLNYDPITGDIKIEISDNREELKVIGYYAYFELMNGFKKGTYWSKGKVEKHAQKYSKSYTDRYGKVSGVWASNFDAMARKTVLKNLLSNYGILSIELQKAIQTDMGTVIDDNEAVEFIDNPTIINEVTPEEPKKTKKIDEI